MFPFARDPFWAPIFDPQTYLCTNLPSMPNFSMAKQPGETSRGPTSVQSLLRAEQSAGIGRAGPEAAKCFPEACPLNFPTAWEQASGKKNCKKFPVDVRRQQCPTRKASAPEVLGCTAAGYRPALLEQLTLPPVRLSDHFLCLVRLCFNNFPPHFQRVALKAGPTSSNKAVGAIPRPLDDGSTPDTEEVRQRHASHARASGSTAKLFWNWVWVKIKPTGDHRIWFMFPFCQGQNGYLFLTHSHFSSSVLRAMLPKRGNPASGEPLKRRAPRPHKGQRWPRPVPSRRKPRRLLSWLWLSKWVTPKWVALANGTKD